jgi:NAD(P)-dependent dehydrogenase (short-subunit alcohol dehydrogenase family)
MSFSLKGHTMSTGIGRMIAKGFLAQGAKVYISARKAQACIDTAKELSQFGTCIAIPGGVSFTRQSDDVD